MKKQVKAHMLPTDDEGVVMTDVGAYNTDMIVISKLPDNLKGHERPHNHIYITSDEKIKEGDHILSKYSIGALYIDGKLNTVKMLAEGKWRKIIATSDRSLKIKIPLENRTGLHVTKKLPNVSQDFIKAFVESNGKEDWEIEYEQYGLCVPCNEQGVRHCAHPEECGYSQVLDELKLDSDNYVILSAIETCEHPFKRLHWVGTKVYCNKCNTTLTKPVE
jgi:hypothetical protein